MVLLVSPGSQSLQIKMVAEPPKQGEIKNK
jgi:hypothetical protein